MLWAEEQLVVFHVNEQRFCVALSRVERVVQVVEIAPLPSAPAIVLGVMNLQGSVVAVFDVRARLGGTPGVLRLEDHVLVARGGARLVGLLVDSVQGVIQPALTQFVSGGQILPGLSHVDGVVKLSDGLLYVHDLDRFLSPSEETQLEAALLAAHPGEG